MVSLNESMAGRFLRHEPVVDYPGLKSDDSMIKTGDLYLALKRTKTSPKKGVRSTLTKGSAPSNTHVGGRG